MRSSPPTVLNGVLWEMYQFLGDGMDERVRVTRGKINCLLPRDSGIGARTKSEGRWRWGNHFRHLEMNTKSV